MYKYDEKEINREAALKELSSNPKFIRVHTSNVQEALNTKRNCMEYFYIGSNGIKYVVADTDIPYISKFKENEEGLLHVIKKLIYGKVCLVKLCKIERSPKQKRYVAIHFTLVE
ncbi:MAG: hypothetical protein ACK4NC_01900 [Candidatus Gracilibacteria bacterium]